MAFLRSVLFILTTFLVSNVYARVTLKCQGLFVEGPIPSQRAPYDTAIELEMTVPDALLDMLTTASGTIREFVSGYRGSMVKEEFEKTINKLPNGWDTRLDDIALNLRRKMFRSWVHFEEKSAFEKIKFKETIRLTFKKKVRFLGKNYKPGTYTFRTADFLTNEFHPVGREELEAHFGAVEIHVRTNLVFADEALASAWIFQQALGVPFLDMQAHLVGPAPAQSAPRFREVNALRQIEFRRRNEIFARMLTLFEGSLFENSDEENSFVTPMDYQAYKDLQGYWLREITRPASKRSVFDQKLKAIVPQRAAAKYDQKNIVANEIRFIPATNLLFYTQWVRRVQDGLLYEKYFIDKDSLNGWIREMENRGADWSDGLFPFHDLRNVASEHPTRLLGIINKIANPKIITEFTKRNFKNFPVSEDLKIQFIFFDWTRDPLFWNDPAAKELILDAQLEAIKQIARGRDLRTILLDFLEESGLWDAYRESFDMPDWFPNSENDEG